MTYETLKDDNDFEILNIEPYTIRNAYTKKECNRYIRRDGYTVISFNGIPKYFHKLLAIQFIPNPSEFKYVRFIDGNKNNITLSNIKWCSRNEINTTSNRIRSRTNKELKEMNEPLNLSRSQLRRWNELHNTKNSTEINYSECDDKSFEGFIL